MAIVLASLALLALGIFGPGIANGLVSGGPQLGAGAAIGAGIAAAGTAAAGVGATGMASRAISGAVQGGALMASDTSASFREAASGKNGAAGIASGLVGMAKAGADAALHPFQRAAAALKHGAESGNANVEASSPSSSPSSEPPQWAKSLKRSQSMKHGITAATHAVRAGDSHGSGSSVNLSEGN